MKKILTSTGNFIEDILIKVGSPWNCFIVWGIILSILGGLIWSMIQIMLLCGATY